MAPSSTLHDKPFVFASNSVTITNFSICLQVTFPILSTIWHILSKVEVERVNSIRAIVVPGAGNTAKHIYSGILIAIGSVMVIETWIQLDIPTFDNASEIDQINVERTHSENQ